jgi:hypothetical protein
MRKLFGTGLIATKEPVTFTAACAIERDYIYIASKPDRIDSEEAFSRLFFFDQQNINQPWLHHDLPDWDVVSVCTHANAFGAKRVYCALSRNGNIEYRWPGGELFERIEEAGVDRSTLPIFGYVNAIREIAGQLYVCGSGGQIYMRVGGRWLNIAPALKRPAQAPTPGLVFNAIEGDSHDFSAIDGNAADNIYVVGNDGEIQHFNGVEWGRSMAPNDEILTSVHCAADGQVWVCGFNGTLLRGTHEFGFIELSAFDDNMIFNSVITFENVPYMAASEGLFRLHGGKIELVMNGDEPAMRDVFSLDVRDGVLWCFSYTAIARFDGTDWLHISHPDNA